MPARPVASLWRYFHGSSVTTTIFFAPSARDLARDDRHREPAVVALPAGHRDRVVEQDLVGDVDAGRGRARGSPDSRNDCRCRRRDSGTRALRLENGASPIQFAPSPPMWVQPSVDAVHPLRHEVAADARIGAHALAAPRSRNCAGSPSRNTACAPTRRSSPRAALCACFSRATRLGDLLVGPARAARARRSRSRCRSDRARP